MSVYFASEEQWMDVLCKLNIQATGISKWSNSKPRCRASNSKWKTGCERRTEEQIFSSSCGVYTWWESHYNVYRRCVSETLAETPSRYCGVTRIQNKSLKESSESSQMIGRRERIFLALEKSMCSTDRHTWCRWHNCGEHNCRHNQVHISSARAQQ